MICQEPYLTFIPFQQEDSDLLGRGLIASVSHLTKLMKIL